MVERPWLKSPIHDHKSLQITVHSQRKIGSKGNQWMSIKPGGKHDAFIKSLHEQCIKAAFVSNIVFLDFLAPKTVVLSLKLKVLWMKWDLQIPFTGYDHSFGKIEDKWDRFKKGGGNRYSHLSNYHVFSDEHKENSFKAACIWLRIWILE